MQKQNNASLRWLISQTKRFAPSIILVCILNAVTGIIGVFLAFLSRNLLDSQDSNNKLLFGISLLSAVVISILISSLVSIITVRISGKLMISIRSHLFLAVTKKRYPEISGYHSGELINRLTSDVDVISNFLAATLPSVVSMAVRVIAGVFALATMNLYLALLVLCLGFAVPALGRILSRQYKRLHKQVQQTEGESRAFMQESIENIVVVKSFGGEKHFLDTLNAFLQKNFKTKLLRNWFSVVIGFFMNSFFSLGYYGVLVWGAMGLGSSISFGTLNAFLILISQLRAPLQNISGVLPQYYQALASTERLLEIENLEDEPLPQNDNLASLQKSFESISFNNVAFAYDNEMVLKNCSFSFGRGEIAAFTGESGCGKSTIFKLLLGLYEVSGGSILLNGDTPLDSSMRGLFSYVPQRNMFFSGTIRENLTMRNRAFSEEQLVWATKAADIYDYLSGLPNGFDTVISEQGVGLSEGQLQRLSIARALLFDSPVLLLDEATSALDEATETTVLSNIKNLTDKTVLFITHRNSSLSVCDRIFHAENGTLKTL